MFDSNESSDDGWGRPLCASPLAIQAQEKEIRALRDENGQLRKELQYIQSLYKKKTQDQECREQWVQRSKDAEMSKLKQDCHSWCKRAQSAS